MVIMFRFFFASNLFERGAPVAHLVERAMDTKAVFTALYDVCAENAAFFSGGRKGPQGDAARRLVEAMTLIQEHARSLEPVISGLTAIYHHFDFDPQIPANGYRSLVKFTPAIRPFLQTIAIGLVSFGENYRRHQSGIVEAEGIAPPYGVAASSFFTSGKYAIDPELRGAEFERITQNLDVHFWKSFWNITETEVLSSLASMTSTQVKVNRALSVPPVAFDLPLVSDPRLSVTDSEELLAVSRSEGAPLSLSLGLKTKRSPPSPCLLVHFHGGGFVAQTSKSHEPYLKSWSQDLGVPILSVDYSLAPEAPFPRALEECFYAYCWALKNCSLLGWTGERVCLGGDSAGGNLCLTVSMRAASQGVRMPDGIMAAYPATLLTAYASPSRLLTLMDPLLPLSVLSRCLSAYAGTEPQAEKQVEKVSTLSMAPFDLCDDFAPPPQPCLFLWKSVSEATLSSPHSDPPVPPENSQFSLRRESLKSQTCQDLGSHRHANTASSPLPSERTPDDVSFFLSTEDERSVSGSTPPPVGGAEEEAEEAEYPREFPEGFEPVRSEHLAEMRVQSSPIVRNPYMSPLLAPDSMLRGLPPVHIVACALDPMLDDSVMFAKRLRNVDQPVTLCVVEDLPHGFLSLSQLSRETREAANVCVERIREVFAEKAPPPPAAATRKHRKLERTDQAPSVARPLGGPALEEELFPVGGDSIMEEEELPERDGQNNSDSREIGA
ncbi:hypothetical protein JZ751_007457 [Albula glossodonta]|uniref:Hormone-sensitive lipase n=1 Tax=Albula glossodonta TaxID=121402 RepID=A0A8T2N3J9_9TELE|nr:hypothetical protein JZ751_007457 [Albula glossodonta]